MKKIVFIFILFSGFGFSQSCPPQDTISISPVQDIWNIPNENNWNGLEVMTWNVKQFPQSSNTISYLNEILTDILPDVVVFQEITDVESYNLLGNSIPAYTFILSNYGSSGVGLELGLAFRNDCVELIDSGLLFSGDEYWFAWRLPFYANLQWQCGTASQVFQLINVHFKCCNDGFDRRLVASEMIRDYIQEQLNNGESNIVVAGDFNDEINEPDSQNSLLPLVEASDLVFFTTTPIVDDDSQQSYPFNYNSFIDHILISSGLFDENNLSGEIQTLRLDDYLGSSAYQNHVSDHRPVLWKIWIESGEIPEGLVINEIMQNPEAVSDTYGEWFEVTNVGSEPVNLNGLIIQDNNSDSHTINSGEDLILNPGTFFVLAKEGNPELNGGVNVDYVYSNFNLTNTWDAVIIKHPAGIILDQIFYDNGATFPDPVGSSMMLVDPFVDNELGDNWIPSTQSYGDGDLGTPGSSNFSENGFTINVTVNDGWNLIGLPVMVDDSYAQSVFPSSVSGTLYGYEGVYNEDEYLIIGNGYWLRFNENENITLAGQEITTLSISLSEGWNLITGISQEINVDDILDPASIVISGTFYEFDGTYTNSISLEPGNGYWIKSNASGTITLTFSAF